MWGFRFRKRRTPSFAVRSGESPLPAFVSSVMVEELQAARDRVVQVLDGVRFLHTWAFEYTPASSQDLDWSYLEKVRRAAFVFWLVGCSTTEPVEREIAEAISAHRRLIIMLLPAPTRDERTTRLLEQARTHAKYREPADLDELAVEIDFAVSDEINRALKDLPGMGRIARLDELGRASRARCIERWQAAGVELAQALDLANDMSVGVAPALALPSDDRPLVILRGEVGIGKSLAAERYHQAAIAAQLSDTTQALPVYVRARDVTAGLAETVVKAAAGLGDPRQQGAAVILDGADEPGIGAAADLLRQARELARTWPSTHIVMTSRPVSPLAGTQEACDLSRLTAEEARDLVGRVAGFEITLGRQAGWSENLREAIELPLFAVLLGTSLRRSVGQMPASRAELLRSLVEAGVGRVKSDARPLLRRLAVLSLRRGGGPVPEAEVAAPHELVDLEETRLVVARDRTVAFPLIVIAQWFAAESLIAGEPTVGEIVDDSGNLEDWRYPLAIVAGTYGYDQVTALIGPLAEAHPGFGSQIVEEGLAKWSNTEDVLPPAGNECGRRVRETTERWIGGLGDLALRIAPVGADGSLLPTGADVSGHWLTTGWYAGTEQHPAVTRLPHGLQGFLATNDPKAHEWIAVRSARPGRQAAWAWRWSFEQLRDALGAMLNRRGLRLTDGPMEDSWLWTIASALLELSFAHDEPIVIESLMQAIPNGAKVVGTRRGRLVVIAGVKSSLEARLERDERELLPPFPGPDQPVRGPYIWNPWSDTRLLERTSAVFRLALVEYQHITKSLFSALAPWMQMAVTLPARLHGQLQPPDAAAGFGGGPTMTWWLEAQPCNDAIQVAIEIDHDPDRDAWRTIGPASVARARELRPEQARWLDMTLHSQYLDVFQPWAAEELVYKWLWDDLKRIRWVDGTLHGRPTGYAGQL